MGYLSCNAESAIATCDTYNWDNLTRKTSVKKKQHPTKSNRHEILDFTYAELHSATNGFSETNLLGKGSHGSVYRAHFVDKNLVAAVKKTKQTDPCGNSTSCTNAPAENEIEILSRVFHPRLVNLLGFGVDSSNRQLIVVEYMPNGSLYELLHVLPKPPGWSKRVRFMLQVAKAVRFLHGSNPPVIHRDIKSSNILIDRDLNARVSDFGLALRGHVEDVRVRCTPPAGTLGYLDPGYLVPGDLSAKSDVFSFGILMLEVISGRNAIDMNYSPPSVVDWAMPAIKSGDYTGICDPRIGPPTDATALRRLAVLAARCVRSTAEKRPGMAEVVECLMGVYKRVKNPVWNNLGRRVGECSRVVEVEHEALDESLEIVRASRAGCRRNGKVSSVTSVELRSEPIEGKEREKVGRSKSIGSVSEIVFGPLDPSSNNNQGRRRAGLAVKMPIVRLNKSRSMGMLQGNNNSSTRLVNNINAVVVQLVRNPNGKEEEESKLLVNLEKDAQKEDL